MRPNSGNENVKSDAVVQKMSSSGSATNSVGREEKQKKKKSLRDTPIGRFFTRIDDDDDEKQKQKKSLRDTAIGRIFTRNFCGKSED